MVQKFYDDFGWKKSDAGLHNDTVQFTDTSEVSQSYRRHCNARICHLLTGGVVLVDAACGAIPHPEYLDFSTGYKVRVCVDFSVRALREAQQKLGDRGIYLLGDITHLPLNDHAADDVISLHTIYHLPKTEQSAAIDELSRVTKRGGRTIVVYVWASSFLMNCSAATTMFMGRCRRFVSRRRRETGPPARPRTGVDDPPSLFFCPQDHAWFAREIMPHRRTSLRVWSSVDVRFQKRFFSNTPLGRLILRVVLAFEDYCPLLAGRIGQYPMFVLEATPVGPTRPPIRSRSR